MGQLGIGGGGNPGGGFLSKLLGGGADKAGGCAGGKCGDKAGGAGMEKLIQRLAKALMRMLQQQGGGAEQAGGAGGCKGGSCGGGAGGAGGVGGDLKQKLLDELQKRGVQITPEIQGMVDQAMQTLGQGGGGLQAAGGG